jgi:hypothetical protein
MPPVTLPQTGWERKMKLDLKLSLTEQLKHWDEYDVKSALFPQFIGGAKLIFVNDEETLAYYSTKPKLGFPQGYYIEKLDPDSGHPIWKIGFLTGNTWGKGNWLEYRVEYFRTIGHLVGYFHIGGYAYHDSMTENELIQWMKDCVWEK